MRFRLAALLLVGAALVLSGRPALATAYTSSQSGNWSAAATWGGAGVPTSGDTVTIANTHTVTVDSNVTIGNSPASAIAVVTVNAGGALTIGTGNSFTLLGGLFASGPVTMAAGSTMQFDGTASAIKYPYKAVVAAGKLVINGT